MIRILILIALIGLQGCTQSHPRLHIGGQAVLHPDGYIVGREGEHIDVSDSDTSGVQELIDYAASHHTDAYIMGGTEDGSRIYGPGGPIVYNVSRPLVFPPIQGFRLDTGSITLNIAGPHVQDKPGITFDACMMADVRIRGQVVYWGKDYSIAFEATNLFPVDTFAGSAIVASSFHVTAIVAGDVNAKGCVKFAGAINNSDFFFNEINEGAYGIHAAATGNFHNNDVRCPDIHAQRQAAVRVESHAGSNVWNVRIVADGGVPVHHEDGTITVEPRTLPVGIDTDGSDDLWHASILTSGGTALRLGPDASGNQFHLIRSSGTFVNEATEPSNTISLANQEDRALFTRELVTPAVPVAGAPIMNRRPWSVQVIITDPGETHAWTLIDALGEITQVEHPLNAGQTILLRPGESIAIDYSTAPAWTWR